MNEQTEFWQGQFGNDYTARNINLVENNYQMFKKIFEKIDQKCLDKMSMSKFPQLPIWKYDINSIIEFGSGSGQNIQALQRIFPDAEYTAVEINSKAVEQLKAIKGLEIYQASILDDWKEACLYDLVLSKGLLIHIHPDNIQKAYDVLYNASNKYILLCEYYNPVLQPVIYYGNEGKLWKRDFVGELLNKYSDLSLVDYGFCYNRKSDTNNYIQDSITWFLLQKN